jgi:hypothetical protein
MQLTSSSFQQGEMIPGQYTCKGKNISPSLSWSGIPEGAKSLALILEDPDAPKGTLTHWIVYNIDPGMAGLPENLPKNSQENGANGLMQGQNDFKKTGYSGPCPPKGSAPHHYYFKLFALDTALNLPPAAGKTDVRNALQAHILAEGDLMGLYGIK